MQNDPNNNVRNYKVEAELERDPGQNSSNPYVESWAPSTTKITTVKNPKTGKVIAEDEGVPYDTNNEGD